nr:MAG TPA: Receptor recognition protein, Long tail, Helical sandwich, Tail fiber [Crassvirales sp.]
MSAKGKELRVSTSVNRATALGNSSGELPNVMYFPTDDPNSIIFNGKIYDLNRLITAPVILDDAKSLDTYKGISNAGVYVGKSGNKISNKPGGVDAFILQAFSYLPNEIHYQILYSGDKIYSRRYVESSSLWTPWKELGAEGLTSIPKATTSALGGVMLGYTNSGRNYKLELDSNGKAFVNVPWTNTTYSNATTEVSGLMSTSDKSKLDGITSSADAVSFSRALSSGTKIGTITINGTNTDIYAPTAGTSPTYSQATSSTLGLVKIGYPESGKSYSVKLNSSGQMYVNVPWTDNNTTYGLATTSANGLLKQLSGNTSQYMRGDGTWATPPNTTYSLVGANGSTGLIKNGSSITNASGYIACPIIRGVPYYRNTTYSIATASSSGLMSASDKSDFDEIRADWVNGGVFVHENSSLYNLAIRDGSPSSKVDELAIFLDDGTLSNSAVALSQIALVDKSNVWSVYQDFKAGAGNSGSDMRFKKEVEPVTSISESIAKLDIIQYIWEHPDEERIRNTFGVKADQLLELGGIFATMVHSRGDKYKTKWVEYDRFGVLAIKAIQELLKKLEYCETEIAKLKTKL